MDDRLRAYLEVARPSDEQYVDGLFGFALRRAPDPEARERALTRLADGTLSRAALAAELLGSDEFERIRILDDAIALARAARNEGERPRRLQGPPGTDERVIEIPWVLSRLRSGRVLDVGYAYAEPSYLAALLEAAPGDLVGVDLAQSDVPGMETIQADIRALPFEDGSFAQILLVSTIEHVGADNSVYGIDDAGAGGREEAMRELRRVLAPGGTLLVTVPLGEPGDHGWFRQEDIRGWSKLFTRSGFFVDEQEAYELGPEGWRAAPSFVAAGVRYGERGPAASAVLCAELSRRTVGRVASPDGMRRTLRRRGGPLWRRLRPLDDA